MKKIIFAAALLASISSCKKDNNNDQPQKPEDFYISFKTADSTYLYKTDDKFTYQRGGSTSLYPNYSFQPNTYFTPLPVNTNVHSIGFQFEYVPACQSCTPDMAQYGNELFNVGVKKIYYTGSPATQLYQLYVPANDGVIIFWTDTRGKLLNSTPDYQPVASFYRIDSVIDQHYVSPTSSLYDYEKIIVGRFTCRVFDPENKTYYKDFTEGKFRIPVWKNKVE